MSDAYTDITKQTREVLKQVREKSMTEAQNAGELEYGSILPNGEDWRLRRFDAGMGETEYRIFRNEKFFAMFDNRQDADTVMGLMTGSAKSSDKVLDELHFIAEMDRMSFDNAICLSGIEEGSRKEDFIKIMALANIGKKVNVSISVRK